VDRFATKTVLSRDLQHRKPSEDGSVTLLGPISQDATNGTSQQPLKSGDGV